MVRLRYLTNPLELEHFHTHPNRARGLLIIHCMVHCSFIPLHHKAMDTTKHVICLGLTHLCNCEPQPIRWRMMGWAGMARKRGRERLRNQSTGCWPTQ